MFSPISYTHPMGLLNYPAKLGIRFTIINFKNQLRSLYSFEQDKHLD